MSLFQLSVAFSLTRLPINRACGLLAQLSVNRGHQPCDGKLPDEILKSLRNRKKCKQYWLSVRCLFSTLLAEFVQAHSTLFLKRRKLTGNIKILPIFGVNSKILQF